MTVIYDIIINPNLRFQNRKINENKIKTKSSVFDSDKHHVTWRKV